MPIHEAPIHEAFVYMHGVSTQRDDDKSHQELYERLHGEVLEANRSVPPAYVGIEWGWAYRGIENAKGHELLTRAQANLAAGITEAVNREVDFTLNPLRLALKAARPLIAFGFADAFYYTSADGKRQVRSAMILQIVEALRDEIEAAKNGDTLISLSFVAHSAGSMAVFDLLYYLFGDPDCTFIRTDHDDPDADVCERANDAISPLRELARDGKLRIRRFFSLGSPIAPLAVRADPVLEILADPSGPGALDPAQYGLTRNPSAFGDPLDNPRWINMWDKDDLIAWPIEPLMQYHKSVKDWYVDVSDSVAKAHNAYWSSIKVQRLIADKW